MILRGDLRPLGLGWANCPIVKYYMLNVLFFIDHLERPKPRPCELPRIP
ncbi:MAG: hypothetical protein QW502_04170 [Candidatus Bathyarchaeia archaeon]